MTEEQRSWLEEHKDYSVISGPRPVVGLTAWADEGWLFANGRYVADDGTVFFGFSPPKGAERVGRECYIT